MIKLKHTPGPWRTCHNGECECGFIYGPEYIVAVTQHKYDDIRVNRETFEANARLIAAAPEMLDDYIWIEHIVSGVKFGNLPPDVALNMIKIIAEANIEKATGMIIEEVLA